MEETWKPVANYEGLYEVSNLGRVRSLTHSSGGIVDWRKGRILKQSITNGNLFYVSLSKEGCPRTHYVKFLVAEAFVPNKKGYEKVAYIDGNTANNRSDNLVWKE